jgi:hypothetical protein
MFIGKWHTQGATLEYVLYVINKLAVGQLVCPSDNDGTNCHYVLEQSLAWRILDD